MLLCTEENSFLHLNPGVGSNNGVDVVVVTCVLRFESEVEKPEYLEEGWKKGGGRNRRVKGKGEWEEG
uniref:Uncharacterized protein n=1 Tax=Vespula pensylvanica TaxID=30213 RepID=A0A834NS94_VESPE|nr:hypothetical protein H0235_011605 [Vespula pensylvanica]